MATDIKNDATLVTNLISVLMSDSTAIITDLHGTNDVTNVNGVSTVTGVQGNAGDFENSSSENQHLKKTDPGSWDLDISGDMSIAFWIKLETSPTGTTYIVVRDDGQPNRNYAFAVDATNFKMFNSVDGQNAGTVGNKAVAHGGLNNGTDYHVAMIFDASAGSFELYVNNVSKGTATGLNTSVYTGGTASLYIGAYAGTSNFLDGIINQLCIWNKKISATEVSDLYNSGTGIPYEGVTNVTATAQSKARVKATQEKTSSAKARLLVGQTKTSQAKARVKVQQEKTITSKARIDGNGLVTVQAKSNIFNTVDTTAQAKAKLKTEVTKTVSSKAKMKGTNSSTVDARAGVAALVTQTASAKAKIASPESGVILGTNKSTSVIMGKKL